MNVIASALIISINRYRDYSSQISTALQFKNSTPVQVPPNLNRVGVEKLIESVETCHQVVTHNFFT